MNENVKQYFQKLMKNPFNTCVETALYIIAWGAGIWCVIAAIGFVIKMLAPLFPLLP